VAHHAPMARSEIGPAQTNACLKELFREKDTLVTKTFPIVLLSVVLAGLALSSAFAGGLWLCEEATPDMGVGGAGRQASMPRPRAATRPV